MFLIISFYQINISDVEVKYKVNEKLVQVGKTTAIGRTKSISGKIFLNSDNSFDTSSIIKVDLSTLKSDQERRDRYIKTRTLEVDRYPFAEFYPQRIEGIKEIKDGNYDVKIYGKLKIKDVIKNIVWSGKIQIKNNKANVLLKTEFPFDYFNLQKPKVPVVIEIDDPIVLEVEGIFDIKKD
ncbi:MAG: YceI family protein [candidate division WOR-3 bacterium]